jgi:hypothetical protein
MKKHFFFGLYLIFQTILIPYSLSAQLAVKDSSSQQGAFNKAIGAYFASEGKQSPIFNGQEYFDYPLIFTGNAYFMDIKAFTNGNIFFDGTWYMNIKMLYDLKKDMIVVLLFNNFTKITLVKQKIINFDYQSHHFKNINTDTIKNSDELPSGFYSQPYNGKTEVLIKYSKDIISTGGQSNRPPEFNFTLFTKYFLMVNKHYYRIRGTGSILNAFKDKKQEIKKFIRTFDIDFYDHPEEALVRIANYYDDLKK